MSAPNLFPAASVQPEDADERLVARAQGGDADAFGALVRRHQSRVAGVLISLLRDRGAAEDVAQEAFVKAYRGLGSFQGRSSFFTWVTSIALNEARSRLRREKLRAWLPWPREDDDGRPWEERLSDGLEAREREAAERRIELERAMDALSPREREVAAMRLEGYELSEIARALGVVTGTVKSTLFAATRKMKERLG